MSGVLLSVIFCLSLPADSVALVNILISRSAEKKPWVRLILLLLRTNASLPYVCQQAQNTAALLDHCVVSALNPFVDIAPRCGCCVMGSERSLTSYVEDVRCVGNSPSLCGASVHEAGFWCSCGNLFAMEAELRWGRMNNGSRKNGGFSRAL